VSDTSRPARAKASLRTRLVRHVVGPLVLTWALGGVITLVLSSYFVAQAYDRALLDDAYAVASRVRDDAQGQPSFHLSSREMGTLLFDQSESMYFAVLRDDGSLIAGHGGLQPPPLPVPTRYRFGYGHLHGRDVRLVVLRRDPKDEFTVVMAQTTASRNQLLDRLLAYSALPQLLLLIGIAWWLRRVIAEDLRPLAQLQEAVNRRDANDLTPLPDPATAQARSREVEGLGSAINSLLARLAYSLNAQREFAGNVAHELRTPLAGIRAQAEYALAQDDPQAWRAQLQGILRSETRASRQVDQLLALARADEARTALQLRPLALDELVRDVLLRYLPLTDAAGVDLGAVGLDTSTVVRADAGLVEGLLGNLLDNALRYGGTAAQPSITVALEAGPAGVALSVTDNGPGLSAEDRQRLPQRGAQGSAGHQLGLGAGLGLAIVSRYAELLGARFRLDPAPEGSGLCARVVFPPASDSGPATAPAPRRIA